VDSHTPEVGSDLIWGRHAALAALESERPIHRIWCTPELRFSPRFLQRLREAKGSGVLVEEVTWARLGQISAGGVHQGIVLQPAAAETLDLPTLLEGCRGLGEPPLLIALDGLTDPQNLGSIVRSAEALGAHAMVLPQRRSAGLTGSVAKVAAGALEHLPVARVVNLNRALETLKQEGYRVVGLASEGSLTLEEADLSGPLVVVTGSEADGLSMLTRRSCDQLVRVPLRGATPSLNAGVATALVLYEVARRGWMRGLSGTAPAPRLTRPALAAPPLPEPEAAMPLPAESPDDDLPAERPAETPQEPVLEAAQPTGPDTPAGISLEVAPESALEATPEVALEATPEVALEVAPEIAAESEPDSAADLAAELAPERAPELVAAQPSGMPAPFQADITL
jgi:23S rRNA (guanosine2251-2'-O)-methyltransferase